MDEELTAAERGPSRTARAVAALRAVHQLFDGDPKLLDDPIVGRILGPLTIERLHARLTDFMAPAVLALRSHVVLRSRYAEDRLLHAVRRGVTQYVILGAGFDTFAYRQPEWAAPLRIFEVDQPASQNEKRLALSSAAVTMPTNLQLVPCDFERESFRDALRTGGFDDSLPAFVSWLGVMVYLHESAADDVFRHVVSLPVASEIVFTFAPRGENSRGGSRLAGLAGAAGEPWRTYVDPDELLVKVRGFGFSQAALLTPDEAKARYFMGRSDALPPPRHATIASATV